MFLGVYEKTIELKALVVLEEEYEKLWNESITLYIEKSSVYVGNI